MKSELIAVKKFNPNAVDDFVRDFKATLEFAGLSDPSSLASELEVEKVSDSPETLASSTYYEQGKTPKVADRTRNAPLLSQTLVVSIPRDFKVDIAVRGDELKKEDLTKIKNQFDRWIQGLEEAFE